MMKGRLGTSVFLGDREIGEFSQTHCLVEQGRYLRHSSSMVDNGRSVA